MKTLNFLAILVICLVSSVYSKSFIIKTAENYSAKDAQSGKGEEGHLDEKGTSRAECLKGLFGKAGTIAVVDSIFYKQTGDDKEGNLKVNSREFTVQPLAADLGITANSLPGDNTTLAGLNDLLTTNGYQNTLFVWSDKEKAQILAGYLGVADAPLFDKNNYGLIWTIDNGVLTQSNMNCPNLANSDTSSASSFAKISAITFTLAALISLVFVF